jgi:AcrR family transcriptional regulator
MPRVLSEDDVADFRERLCETAAGLYAEKGPGGVTIRELASALGVSPMTPYRYFRDKDEILAAVRTRAFDRFAAALEKAYAQPGAAHERGRAVGQAYIRFAMEEPSSYRLMFDLSQPGEEAYPDLVRAMTRARATMTAHVFSLQDDGLLQGDPELIGHVFWTMLHGAVSLQLAGKLGPKYDLATICQAAGQALSEGFRPKG